MTNIYEKKMKELASIRMRQDYTNRFEVAYVVKLPEDVVGLIRTFIPTSIRIQIAETKYESGIITCLSILTMKKLRKMMCSISDMYCKVRFLCEMDPSSRSSTTNIVKPHVSKFFCKMRHRAMQRTAQRKVDAMCIISTIYEMYRDEKCPTKHIEKEFRKQALYILHVIMMTYEWTIKNYRTYSRRCV
jgi:hypothetical protein